MPPKQTVLLERCLCSYAYMSSVDTMHHAPELVHLAAAHIHMLLYDMRHLGTKTCDEKKSTLPNPPTVVMVDNKAAVQMSLNGKLTKHTRHISRSALVVGEELATSVVALGSY